MSRNDLPRAPDDRAEVLAADAVLTGSEEALRRRMSLCIVEDMEVDDLGGDDQSECSEYQRGRSGKD